MYLTIIISILVPLLVIISFKVPLVSLGIILYQPLFVYLAAGLTGGLIYMIKLFLSNKSHNLSLIRLALSVGFPVVLIALINFFPFILFMHQELIESAAVIGGTAADLIYNGNKTLLSLEGGAGTTNKGSHKMDFGTILNQGTPGSHPPVATAVNNVIMQGPGFTVTRGDLLTLQSTIQNGINNILSNNPSIKRITFSYANSHATTPLNGLELEKLRYVLKERSIYTGDQPYTGSNVLATRAWTPTKGSQNVDDII